LTVKLSGAEVELKFL